MIPEQFTLDDKLKQELEGFGLTLRCGLCGKYLNIGDQCRYVELDESFGYGNQLVCKQCDSGLIVVRQLFFGLKKIWEDRLKDRFWVFAARSSTWHSIDDEPIPKNKQLLVLTKDNRVFSAESDSLGRISTSGFFSCQIKDVTHWFELPSIPSNFNNK